MNKIEQIFDELRDEVRKLLGDPRSNSVDHKAVHAAIDAAQSQAVDHVEPTPAVDVVPPPPVAVDGNK